MSTRCVNRAEFLVCEVGLFSRKTLCYTDSASRRTPCPTRSHSVHIGPFANGPETPRPGGILHAQGSASQGCLVVDGPPGRSRGTDSQQCLSVRAARVPRTHFRRSADLRSELVVRSTAHDLPRIDNLAAADLCRGYAACTSAASRNQPAEKGDSGSGTRGAEAGPATTVDAALTGAAGCGRPHRRKYRRLDRASCSHEGVGRSRFPYGIVAGRTNALHMLDAK